MKKIVRCRKGKPGLHISKTEHFFSNLFSEGMFAPLGDASITAKISVKFCLGFGQKVASVDQWCKCKQLNTRK